MLVRVTVLARENTKLIKRDGPAKIAKFKENINIVTNILNIS